MKIWRLKTIVASLTTIGMIASASGQVADKVDAQYSKLLQILSQKLKAQLAATAGQPCDTETESECIIKMSFIDLEPDKRDSKMKYCVAEVPEVKVDRLSMPRGERSINWKLSDSVVGGKPVEFHSTLGILIMYDSSPPQIKASGRGPGRGDGVGGPAKTYFHVTTLRNKAKAESGYLPLILWGTPGSADLQLCAAVDPKIVNEN